MALVGHANSGGATTQNPTVTYTVVGGAGHFLVCIVEMANSNPATNTLTSVSDGTHSFTVDKNVNTTDYTYDNHAYAHLDAPTAGVHTFTANLALRDFTQMYIFEFDSMGSTNTWDTGVYASVAGTTNATVTSVTSGTPIATGAALFLSCSSAPNPDGDVGTPSTGWTKCSDDLVYDELNVAYQIESTAAVTSNTWTLNSAPGPRQLVSVAAYYAAGGGGATDPFPLVYLNHLPQTVHRM